MGLNKKAERSLW